MKQIACCRALCICAPVVVSGYECTADVPAQVSVAGGRMFYKSKLVISGSLVSMDASQYQMKHPKNPVYLLFAVDSPTLRKTNFVWPCTGLAPRLKHLLSDIAQGLAQPPLIHVAALLKACSVNAISPMMVSVALQLVMGSC